MSPIEYVLRTSTAPSTVILELRNEVERRRREPNAREADITLYVQSILREVELRAKTTATSS